MWQLDKTSSAHARLLADARASADVLAQLVAAPAVALRLKLAAHPNTSGETLACLLADGEAAVRAAALANPNAPADVAAQLVHAGSTPSLQGFAPPHPAFNPAAADALLRLGPWARRLIARHRGTPADTLAALAVDPDPAVRRAIASNPSTSATHLSRLATDAALAIPLAKNPHTPPEVLASLIKFPAAHPWLAAHPAAPPDLVAVLAGHGDANIRALVSVRGHGPRREPAAARVPEGRG